MTAQSIDTSSEQFRHQCEVRWCITQGHEWFATYLDKVKSARGRSAAQRLLSGVKAQHAAGNTGAAGVWIEAGAR